MKIIKTKYCSHCSKKINSFLIGAETQYLYYGDIASLQVGSAYNVENGKRQFVRKFICPDWKSYFFFTNKHDNYFEEDILSI